MNGAPRILIIDDNPVDRDRMIGELRRELPDLSLRHVARESECVEALAAGDFDLVLTEHHLPWTDGLSILRTVKARFPGCPVLVVTGSENEAFAVRDISAGLDGYVLKTPQDLARLPHAVRAAWEHARRQRELEAAAAQCRDLLDRVPVGPYRATQEGKFLDANRFLFESHPHPMWVYDLDSLAFLAVNAAAVRHYGYAREEFLALTIRDIRPPEDIPALLANVAQVTAGLDAAGTWRHRKKDGTIIDVEITSHAILFEGRRAEVVLAYDITDRRRAEEALARRTAQWETIRTATEEIIRELDLATVMGIITRRALELVDGTSGGVALWDESAQLLVPRSWRGQAGVSEQVRWRLGEGVAGTVAQRREGMIVNEYRTSPYAHPLLLAQTGFTAVIAAPLVYRDRLLGVISIDNEGSGRRFTEDDRTILALFAAQAAVAIENARLFGEISRAKGEWENTFDAAADLIAVVDPEYRLVRANRALAQKFRTTPQAVIGRRCYEIFEGFVTPPPECPLAECLRTGRSMTEEWEMPDSGEMHLRTYSPFFDAGGKCVGVVLVSKDITAQRRLQQQLLHSEKMAAMGRLVSGVAHELNNPLTAVFGHAQLLLLGAVDETTRQRAEIIVSEAERAAKIVRNLLSLARPQKPERRSLAINPLIEETLELRAYELNVRNIRVVKELAPDLPAVLADPHQLQQVFLNLLINAEQAVTPGAGRGEIRVRSGMDPGRRWVRVAIEDDGPGIPPGVLDKLFDPFFTTKAGGQGTGLGLSICYTILEEHGGRIQAGNRPQGGAWFECEIPAHGETRPEVLEPPSPRPAEERVGGLRILVADDEAAIVRVVAGALGLQGYQVEVALDGRLAAERLEREDYDLVLMDLKMPGVNGMQLYETISRKPVPPQVVIMTGDTASPETRAFLARTGLRCLEKPFNLEDLWKCVRQFEHTPPGPPGPPASSASSEMDLPLQ